MRLLLALSLVAIVATTVLAQPYGTDVFASSTSRNLFRISPTGQVTTVISGIAATMNMVCMDNDNQHVVIIQTSPPTLFRVDPVAKAIVGTIWQGAPLTYLNYINPTSTGDFLVADRTTAFLVRGDGSAVSTLYAGSPFQGLQGCTQDLVSGNYAMGDLSVKAVFMIAGDGTLVTTYAHSAISPFVMTQDHRDGALLIGGGATGNVHRLDTTVNALTTVTSSAGNANAICFDRWSGNGEIVVGTTTVYRMDINGVVITSHPGIPGTNSGLCFDQGRNLVPVHVGTPNQYRIDVNFPGFAGRAYVMAMSVSGFAPGIPVGGRAVQLIPDNVFILSVQGLLAPLLTNNVGVLSPFARASAKLDLSLFGKLLSGLRVWMAAVVIDPAAPMGVGAISKPYVIVLD